MGTVTLSHKELQRPGLVKAACGGRITNRQVAEALRLSVRQVRRLKRRFEQGGAPALVHCSRGRPSARRLLARLRDKVVRLMAAIYVGFSDAHLTEKLNEEHGLRVSRESVRRLRRALGRPPQRARRPPRARRRRTPEAARGSLVQIDGSPFAWFGAAAPPLCCSAPWMTPRLRSWPFTSGPPKMSTATPRSSTISSRPTACPLPSNGDRL